MSRTKRSDQYKEILKTLSDKDLFALKNKLLEKRRAEIFITILPKGLKLNTSYCIDILNSFLKEKGLYKNFSSVKKYNDIFTPKGKDPYIERKILVAPNEWYLDEVNVEIIRETPKYYKIKYMTRNGKAVRYFLKDKVKWR